MKGTPGAEKKRFQWIRDPVLMPFINWARKEYDGLDVESGASMSDEHTAVSWCDGDNSQIDTIVSEEGIQRYGQQAQCKWYRKRADKRFGKGIPNLK